MCSNSQADSGSAALSSVSIGVPQPQGRYIPAATDGALIVSAGMTPRVDGELVIRGRAGDEVSTAEAGAAARLAARNALAAIDSQVSPGASYRCLQMTVFISTTADFADHSVIADAASEVISEAGLDLPARIAVGVFTLPGNAPVEVTITAVQTGV